MYYGGVTHAEEDEGGGGEEKLHRNSRLQGIIIMQLHLHSLELRII